MRDNDENNQSPSLLGRNISLQIEPITGAFGPLMPLKTACSLACITRTTGHEYISTGKWEAVKVGARTMVTRKSFDDWLSSLPRVISRRGERSARLSAISGQPSTR